MKKLISITLILSLMLAMSAFASRTRVLTMGNNNMVLVDDANIWMFPSRLNDYPGLAVGEFGSNPGFPQEFNSFGIHWKFGDDAPWVLATYFDANMPVAQPHFALPFTPPDDNQRINLLYGRQMGSNNFGFGLSLIQSSDEETVGGSTNKESFAKYDVTFGLTADDRSWDMALNFGFGSWTDETGGIATSEADGLFDFTLMGRMFMDKGPNYTYVPHAAIEYHKLGVKTGATQTEKWTDFIFDFGIGQVYTPSNNVEAVLDFGIMFQKFKYEDDVAGTIQQDSTENFNTIPYFKIGMDAEVFGWMDVRFGATSFWQRNKTEDAFPPGAPNEYKDSFARNATYLGFGFHWGNFHVDTYADPQLFLEGLNFISGANQNMNFQISATYEML